MVANEPVVAPGRIGHLIDWESLLRALLDGSPLDRRHHETG